MSQRSLLILICLLHGAFLYPFHNFVQLLFPFTSSTNLCSFLLHISNIYATFFYTLDKYVQIPSAYYLLHEACDNFITPGPIHLITLRSMFLHIWLPCTAYLLVLTNITWIYMYLVKIPVLLF